MSDFNDTLRLVGFDTIPAGEGRTVQLRRTYESPIDDVWDAITNPERIPRWFLPITGDLRLGGHYQLVGNAGGEILVCEPPRHLKVTWIFGEAPTAADVTEVHVRLSPTDNGETLFELEHIAVVDQTRWDEFGPGAVGVGWDLTLLGLTLHLQGGSLEHPSVDPMAWMQSAEGRVFVIASSEAWGAANEAAGATPEQAKNAMTNTTNAYAPPVAGASDQER